MSKVKKSRSLHLKNFTVKHLPLLPVHISITIRVIFLNKKVKVTIFPV